MKRPATALVRFSRGAQCLLLVLGILVIADAHIVTAAAGDHAIVEATCGAGLPVFTQGMKALAIASMEPIPSALGTLDTILPYVNVYPPYSLEEHSLPTGNCHQDKLYHLVHVFLF
jgi:hypothetical protein